MPAPTPTELRSRSRQHTETLEERQAKLNGLVEELYNSANAIKQMLYESRTPGLRLDPTVASLIGSLLAARDLLGPQFYGPQEGRDGSGR